MPILAFLLLILIFDIPFINMDRVLPLMPTSIAKVISAIPLSMLLFIELSVVSVFLSLPAKKLNKKSGGQLLLTVIGLGIILTLIYSLIVATFGEERAAELNTPMFYLAREIFFETYLSNFQIILFPLLLTFSVLKVAVFMIGINKGLIHIGWTRITFAIPYFLAILTIILIHFYIPSEQTMIRFIKEIGINYILPTIILLHFGNMVMTWIYGRKNA